VHGIDYPDGQRIFQQVEQWFPELASALHRDVNHLVDEQPSREPEQIGGRGGKAVREALRRTIVYLIFIRSVRPHRGLVDFGSPLSRICEKLSRLPHRIDALHEAFGLVGKMHQIWIKNWPLVARDFSIYHKSCRKVPQQTPN
jgi:hypothetical protein